MYDDNDIEERMKYKAREVLQAKATLLSASSGNFDHDNGESATIVFVEYRSGIEPMVFSLKDTRRLVAEMLNSLYTANDPFAEKVLETMFPHDKRGKYHWPESGD